MQIGDKAIFRDGRLVTILHKLAGHLYHYSFYYNDDKYKLVQYSYEWELVKIDDNSQIGDYNE